MCLGGLLKQKCILNLFRVSKVRRCGVVLPRGIGELKDLDTLGVVHVSRSNGKATIEEFVDLTQLRKLKVVGMSCRNSNDFWSAIVGHNQLQSLSVEAREDLPEERNRLDGCLSEGLLPPSSLDSLTLFGRLVCVTAWIHKLQNLSKLVLERTELKQDDDATQALGCLPCLAVLRLKNNSFVGTQLHFQSSSFLSLMVLELDGLRDLESVLFEDDTMPKLELLQVSWCYCLGEDAFSGLTALTSLKEIRLTSKRVQEEVQRQVAEHMKDVRVNN